MTHQPTLESIAIRTFRNVDATTLYFSSGPNVVIGRNAAGKTTLLNLIAAVLGSGFTWCKGEKLDLGWCISLQGFTIESNLRLTPKRFPGPKEDVPLQVQTAALADNVEWTVNIAGQTLPTPLDIEYTSEHGIAYGSPTPGTHHHHEPRHFNISRDTGLWAFLFQASIAAPSDYAETLEKLLFSLPFGIASGPRRFDESLDTYNEIFRSTGDRSSAPRLAGTTVTFFRSGIDEFYPSTERLPYDLAMALLNVFLSGQDAPELRCDASNVAFIRGAPADAMFDRPLVRLELIDLVKDGDSISAATFGNLSMIFASAQGRHTFEYQLSYGQKRLLAFLFEASRYNGPFVADELVNGLHHSWISHCMAILSDRQSFLTSQNPLLFDYLSFSSAEDVKRTFAVCRITPQGTLSWYNLREDEAIRFYEAYRIGIQHISEILKEKDLW